MTRAPSDETFTEARPLHAMNGHFGCVRRIMLGGEGNLMVRDFISQDINLDTRVLDLTNNPQICILENGEEAELEIPEQAIKVLIHPQTKVIMRTDFGSIKKGVVEDQDGL
ncbi:hypothetical protein NDU88_004694 [Pleurodeles waltl]|uniref:Uncharacterized protein n=1 Tax=Pleurodeles waltl TaxID=8319 RepID=A0AAV7SJI7_PLEWA|nr:hypothetical protein NDU88_004694 [Pleurodeles waltl]